MTTKSQTIICLACYQQRLASLFENAVDLLFFHTDEDCKICPAGHLSLPQRDPSGRASTLCSCGVNILICGAISSRTKEVLNRAGIEVIPWIRGDVQAVLEAWKNQSLSSLSMPGTHGSAI